MFAGTGVVLQPPRASPKVGLTHLGAGSDSVLDGRDATCCVHHYIRKAAGALASLALAEPCVL